MHSAAAALAVASALIAATAAPAASAAPAHPVPAQSAPAGQAAAQARPAFLEPGDLPPYLSSPWIAEPVTAGVPDPLPFCVGEALPASIASHRVFRTDLDAAATQTTVVERDPARARSLAALWARAVRDCAERTEQQNPDITAEGRDYGRVTVGDGAQVYGVHVAHSAGSSNIHLFAVGRDGRTVTVVTWGALGGFEDAPVKGFRKTARTAVGKLA
ncbi:hypothetical protein [Streptomyces formicae]|uniref:PknH-like extracellular domain-containing protein n=1 Tax=Streptomyces formicae TaxID=1616117 RepID=A0ABY3WJ74_9ACTN|nr:hypothetical protein [Streptomyces formicae]UNM12647.1 hypothetical protein J4032_14950 [Streptomyces formicae]